MATWRAKCWLGSASGYQELEVQSNTSYGAKEQFERIYGAKQIINLHQVRNSSGGSSSTDYSGCLPIIFVLLVLGLIIEYWYIIVPIAVILGVLIWIGWNAED